MMLHYGLKLHFGNSDVDLANPQNVAGPEGLRSCERLSHGHRGAHAAIDRQPAEVRRGRGNVF